MADIAVIGLSGRYPGAEDVDAFWRRLVSGDDCVTEIPADRWDTDGFYDPDRERAAEGRSYSRWGAFLDGIDQFDPLLFGISPREAEVMDPQERLFLQVAWAAFESAGYPRRRLRTQARSVGVFAGVTSYTYLLWGPHEWARGNPINPQTTPWSLANRVSYLLDLSGPSMPVDTACSSSLTALHLACDSLRSGECDLALAGGVNLYLHPARYVTLSQARMLSPTGRCRSFGAGGDGFVPGEGVGAVLLKPLDAALRDRDHVYGVIKGTAVNHGGYTTGYTVPNPAAQAAVVARAQAAGGVDPRTVSYIEAHGTGTDLGDPIEVAGLTTAFREGTTDRQFCALGSVKSNIGHLEAAAGIAGLTKVLLQMRHRTLAPTLHCDPVNPNLDLAATPFYLQGERAAWAQPRVPVDGGHVTVPRRAGISSFGAGGANAHVVVEEYPQPAPTPEPTGPQLVVLSARTHDRLRAYAGRLAGYLRGASTGGDTGATVPIAGPADGGDTDRLAEVAALAGAVLGVPACRLDPDEPLAEQGLDVIGLATLAGRLAEAAGVTRYADELSADVTLRQLAVAGPATTAGPAIGPDGSGPAGGGADGTGAALRLVDVAHTLRVGREPMAERLALVVSNVAELADRLDAYLAGETDGVHHGAVRDGEVARDLVRGPAGAEYLRALTSCGNWDQLARLWVAGVDVDWTTVPGHDAGRTVPLPTYPFATGRYWFPRQADAGPGSPTGSAPAPGPVGEDRPHPLLGANTSTLALTRFTTLLSGAESVLRDHVIAGRPTLPGVAVLEMARAAAELTGEAPVTGLRDVLWAQPVRVDAPLRVHLALTLADGGARFELAGADGEPVRYAQGRVLLGGEPPAPATPLDVAAIRAGLAGPVPGDDCYRLLAAAGFGYGPTFRAVRELYRGTGGALARWELPAGCSDAELAGLHPSVLDGALHTAMGLLDAENGGVPEAYVPFALAEVVRYAPLPRNGWAYASPAGGSRLRKVDVLIVDEAGRPAVRIAGLTLRALTGTGPAGATARAVPAGTSPADVADRPANRGVGPLLFTADWREAALPQVASEGPAARLLLVEANAELRAAAIGTGLSYTEVDAGGAYDALRRLAAARADARLLLAHPAGSPAGNGLPALARTARLEQPRLVVSTLETDGTVTAAALTVEAARGGADVEVRWRGGRRWVAEWRELPAPAVTGRPLVRPDGAYLVTGGLGGLGRLFVEYLAERGAGTVVVAGRSAPDAAARDWLVGLPVRVVHEAVDVTDRMAVAALAGRFGRKYPPLRGVLHAAGVLRDGLLVTKGDDAWGPVCAPKVIGTRLLDTATADAELDWFVSFSSAAGAVGNPGQAEYAYANRFLDVYAAHRDRLRERGERRGRSLSIGWGLWADGGMGVDERTAAHLERTAGTLPIPTATGLAVFESALAHGLPYVGVLHGRRDTLRERMGLCAAAPVGPVPPPVGPADKDPAGGAADSPQEIESTLAEICAEVLKIPVGELDAEEDLGAYGLDSILMMTVLNRIEQRYATAVEPSALAEYGTLRALARHLHAARVRTAPATTGPTRATASVPAVAASDPVPVPAPGLDPAVGVPVWPAAGAPTGPDTPAVAVSPVGVPPVPTPARADAARAGRATDQRVAVIGLAARLPGSPTVNAFWEHLRAGRDLVRELPADRFDVAALYSPDRTAEGRTYSRWGGFLDGDIFAFDAARFGIDEDDALVMDPHHRVMLELTEELLHDAGYRPEELAGTRAGVFLGGGESNYLKGRLESLPGRLMRRAVVNTIPNMAAARVSDFFDLRGPSQTVDTACSSALVAVHQACQALRTGDCDLAVVGGVELITDGYLHIGFSKAEVLSPGGACRVFDESADGIVPGEGAGLLLLKPYEEAVRDGDDIRAVILGGAVNNDGRTMGLTVPSLDGQRDVLRRALDAAAVRAGEISYLEAHGTGTLLGDPIEIRAATSVYGADGAAPQGCAVGSVKSNIGHLMRAAGAAALIKVVLALRHELIPPTLHCARPHPRFRFAESPFFPVTRPLPWPDEAGRPRRAAVSAFGFGGTNAHLVLAGHVGPAGHRRPLPPPRFARRHYRVGDPVTDVRAGGPVVDLQAGNGKPELDDILDRIQAGTLTPAAAAGLIGPSGFVGWKDKGRWAPTTTTALQTGPVE
ncbi:SDR family NAD(P)-dependent oxidoreductase [Micromonospora sp. KC207]|uniref:SDR family NAD(P)-dependent oxidoreductase n=1 Tax=Micromonospora sp. KC207 TaxID=2530377 RepID=UPI001A9FDC10|nr:SDR family NAD(P)-dependent oxidoreductase [Micromonospora sp. KC207]